VDTTLADFEADRIAAPGLRLLDRGVREAITQAGAFGDDPLAFRHAVESALRGYQDALGPTLQGAQRAGLERATQQQQTRAEEARFNAQQEFNLAIAGFNAQTQAALQQSMQNFERQLAELEAQTSLQRTGIASGAITPQPTGVTTDFSAFPGLQPINPTQINPPANNVFTVPEFRLGAPGNL
jgi:hypothetical protein